MECLSSPLLSVIHIGDADAPFVSFVKKLGVTLDSNLSMPRHMNTMCKTIYRQIIHISPFHTTPSHRSSSPNPRLFSCSLSDYCSSLLSSCSQYLLDKDPKVQKAAAAKLVCKAMKSVHIHPVLQKLQWLPVTYCIQCKISTVCLSSIFGMAHPFSICLSPSALHSSQTVVSLNQIFVLTCVIFHVNNNKNW